MTEYIAQAAKVFTVAHVAGGDGRTVCGIEEQALEGAQGNADEAASMVWAAYKAVHEQASDG